MICIDDLNDWTGFLGGHPQAITPHMDRLAARGRVFTNAHCVVPVCSCSRVSVMSGVGPATHGSYEIGPSYEALPALADVPTLHGWFRQHGYVTITGGKVLHHNFGGRLKQDIDISLGRERGPRPNRPLNRPADWSGAWDWGVFPTGKADGDESQTADAADAQTADTADEQTADVRLAHKAAAALQQNYDRPFFLSVGIFRPHVPLFVPQRWFDLYDAAQLQLPHAPATDVDDVPPNFQSINDYALAPTHADVLKHNKQRSLTHAYLASISFADHCVGLVLDALNKSQRADHTLVVLWSDHGFHLGEKRHWAKRTLWAESTRVPLLIAGPGITPGACSQPVSLLDVYPTLTDFCGLPPSPHVEGLSLGPQLKDRLTPRQRPAITSSYYGNHAVRSEHWRLIHYEDGQQELYDHRHDPDELKNLASDPRHVGVIKRLSAWLPSAAAPEFKQKSERQRRSR